MARLVELKVQVHASVLVTSSLFTQGATDVRSGYGMTGHEWQASAMPRFAILDLTRHISWYRSLHPAKLPPGNRLSSFGTWSPQVAVALSPTPASTARCCAAVDHQKKRHVDGSAFSSDP